MIFLKLCYSIFPILVNIFEKIVNLNDPDQIRENFRIIAKCKLIPKVKSKYSEVKNSESKIELTRPITSVPLNF